MAAIVIVIISNGILNQPINPNTKQIEITFGINAINDTLKDLNKSVSGNFKIANIKK